jgi:hypothetical protein
MFVNAFKEANRETQFSEEAKMEIYDYLLFIESESAEFEPELNIPDICCSFSEVSLDNENELKKYGVQVPVIHCSRSVVFFN